MRHWLDSGAKFSDLGISQNDFLESTADQVIKKPLCPFIINKNPPRISVVFHVFYADQLNKCIDALAKIPSPFDIYVSTTLKLRTIIKSALGDLENLGQQTIEVFPNVGRDIAPFLVGFGSVLQNYDYVLKIHTKRQVCRKMMGDSTYNSITCS